MADFDIAPENTCRECQNIDWVQVASRKGYRLHHSLLDLSECGKTCGLCQRAHEVAELNFDERFWTDPANEDAHLARMQYFVSIQDSHSSGLRLARTGDLYLKLSKSESLFAASNSKAMRRRSPRY
jgi:hypothetical protein